ncbi:MAG: M14-type cytosolic carboxypeptidase [Oceanicaulis sp.]
MHVSSTFDAGNIIVKSADDAGDVRLEIRKDHQSDFYQWFYFKVSGAKGEACRFVIENAGKAAYEQGWPGYKACISSDRETWERAETAYENGELIITATPEADAVWIAYFAPYSMTRHDELIAACQQHPRVKLDVLGSTLDGRDMDRLTIGDPGDGKKTIWVIARQHPGETMAEWAAEGFLQRLLDDADPVSRDLLDKAVVHVVPNMNPDGSFRGHLRTNAKGVNLNREWDKASLENSPEVFCVLEAMRETGVDLFLDMHGDEALPYNFIAGAEGTQGWDDAAQARLDRYKSELKRFNPDFQTEHGYPVSPPGTANPSVATNYMAPAFKCLAMTLEMPFKDSAITPDEAEGWSPARCLHMGASQVDAMRAVLERL